MGLLPKNPPPGPSEESFWQSPIRGPWLTSFVGSFMFPLILIVGFTGFMSHAAYNPNLGSNQVVPRSGDLDLLLFDWPTNPSWLYSLNQGSHTLVGLIVVPLILLKLWSVFPRLFAWPPLKGTGHAVERVTILLLVGSTGFMWATGLLNSQLFYPWKFGFVTAHYYGSWVFLTALFLHVATKLPTIRRAYRERGVLKPLMDDLAHTEPEAYVPGGLAPEVPEQPTISRRGVLALAGASSAGLFLMTAGQSIGGWTRQLALLAPRGAGTATSQGFQVNKGAELARVTPDLVGAGYRMKLTGGAQPESFTREQLLALEQSTQDLPIACVEGWTTWQTWTGVRLRDFAAMAGLEEGQGLQGISLQPRGAFTQVTLSHDQVMNPQSLLALKVNGEDISMDHGFPARLIVPALPGVHNIKWITELKVVPV